MTKMLDFASIPRPTMLLGSRRGLQNLTIAEERGPGDNLTPPTPAAAAFFGSAHRRGRRPLRAAKSRSGC